MNITERRRKGDWMALNGHWMVTEIYLPFSRMNGDWKVPEWRLSVFTEWRRFVLWVCPGEMKVNACRKRNRAYFALKTSEQLNTINVSKLYNWIVLPSVLNGWEYWCDLRAKNIGTLKTFQHFISKHATGLPCHTRRDMWKGFKLSYRSQ